MWCVGIEFASIIMIVYLKTVFVASAVFLFSCCDGETAIQSEHIKMNERPIIGILSQEQDYRLKDKYSQENFMSYISASYVKSVEASGARVLPIFIGKSRNYYKELMSKINGVLYPGGNTWFNQSDGYADAGQHIYEIAQEFNDAGDYFPLFGTCLGFELFVIMASGKDRPENRVHCVAIGNYPLMFTEDYRSSKLFNQISKKSADLLEKENSTVHHHQFCIVDEKSQMTSLGGIFSDVSGAIDNGDELHAICIMQNRSQLVKIGGYTSQLKAMPTGSVQKILHEHLCVRRIVSRWVPHDLTGAQKQARVDWCSDMIQNFDAGSSRRVYDIVTGD
ncbi:hypothetical protein evm_013538 [Chilo suppressalis]|nr:hypothetical protein evm_013538 [Chilo suppressalis]